MRWKLPFSNISFSLSASCVLSHTYDMRFDSKTYIQIENPHRRHNHSNPASLTTVPPLAQFRRHGRATSYKKRCDGMGNPIASSHTTTEPIASCPADRHDKRGDGSARRRYGMTRKAEREDAIPQRRSGTVNETKRNGTEHGTPRRRQSRPARAPRLTDKRNGESRRAPTIHICGQFAHLPVLDVLGLLKLYI